jgi:excisionase family DNA binding protein
MKAWTEAVDVNALPYSLKPEHVAALLGMKRTAVYGLFAAGEIPTARKVGRTWIANRDKVLAWLRGEDRAKRS